MFVLINFGQQNFQPLFSRTQCWGLEHIEDDHDCAYLSLCDTIVALPLTHPYLAEVTLSIPYTIATLMYPFDTVESQPQKSSFVWSYKGDEQPNEESIKCTVIRIFFSPEEEVTAPKDMVTKDVSLA